MSIKLMSFSKIRELIREQSDMPDIYNLTFRDANNIHLARDNYNGMEGLVQQLGSCFGMTVSGLSQLDRRMGWVCVAEQNQHR